MREKIKNKVCYGELQHPADRVEIDPEKIAVCLSEQPVKNKHGQLEAVFDILDTPNGRILKTLCDYGSHLGISSRGQGDIITDENGDEEVDPDTYECECWDVVLMPAVEAARVTYVTESLNTKKSLNEALTKLYENASENDKKVMKETLEELEKVTENENTKLNIEEGGSNSMNDEVKELEIEEPETEEVKAEETETDEIDISDLKDQIELALEKDEDGNVIEDSEFNAGLKKALEIFNSVEESEDTEEDVESEEELHDEEDSTEDDKDKEDAVDEALVTIKSEKGTTTVDTEADTVDVDAQGQSESEPATDSILDTELPMEGEPELDLGTEEAPLNDENSTEELPTEETPDEDINPEEELPLDDEDETNEALDKGSKELIKNLQEAIKGKATLEAQVKSLQKDLAVSDAKVNELSEDVNRYTASIARLATTAKASTDLAENVSKLEESLAQKEQIISDQTLRISRLVKSRRESVDLNESLNNKANEIKTLNESIESKNQEIKTLNESLANSNEEVKKLTESVETVNTLKESYKKLANQAMNALIEERANTLGLTSIDIKRKLGASYTISDVDRVCEELKRYQLNISKLPFSIDKKVSVRVNESLANHRSQASEFDDDDVDDSLIRMANIRY